MTKQRGPEPLHAGSRNPDQLRHRSTSQAAHCRWRKPRPTIRRERRAVCGAANRKQLGANCFGQFALDGLQAAWIWFSGSLLAVWGSLKA